MAATMSGRMPTRDRGTYVRLADDRRARMVRLGLALGAALAVLLGVWGVATVGSGASSATAAPAGQWVSAPGGGLRVDRVDPVVLMAMPGMAQMTGIEPIPDTMQRLTVRVTLAGREGDGLRYAAKQFQLTGSGMKPTTVYSEQLGSGTVPAGSEVSGSLTFQIPKDATGLALTFAGAAQPIRVSLQPGAAPTQHDHTHG